MINPEHYADGGDMWDHARQEYLAGVKATTICQRWGVSLSSFRLHARVGGWRRIDRPDCGCPPEDGEFHPDDDVSFADLADQAFLNIRRALATGRAGEASSWMRLYDKLADRARPEVMADLPDATPPPPPRDPSRDPLFLTLVEDESPSRDFNALGDDPDALDEKMDSLDSVFSEANPAVAVHGEHPATTLDADALGLLRQRRLEPGLPVHDLDAPSAVLSP